MSQNFSCGYSVHCVLNKRKHLMPGLASETSLDPYLRVNSSWPVFHYSFPKPELLSWIIMLKWFYMLQSSVCIWYFIHYIIAPLFLFWFFYSNSVPLFDRMVLQCWFMFRCACSLCFIQGIDFLCVLPWSF